MKRPFFLLLVIVIIGSCRQGANNVDELSLTNFKVVSVPYKNPIYVGDTFHTKLYLSGYDSLFTAEAFMIDSEGNLHGPLPPSEANDAQTLNILIKSKGYHQFKGMYKVKANANSKEIEIPFEGGFTVQ